MVGLEDSTHPTRELITMITYKRTAASDRPITGSWCSGGTPAF